jgi:hypothetical protein
MASERLRSDEIRILWLYAGTHGSQVRASFDVVSLDNLTSYDHGYEAISYAWGERILDHALWIDGVGEYAITKNLYQALQRLRLPNGGRRVWIDAVCIDQQNAAERSLQVAMMGRIFSSAVTVYIWLGESEPEDAIAFAAINRCPPFNEEADVARGVPYHWRNGHSDSLRNIDAQLAASPLCMCCGIPFVATDDTAVKGLLQAKRFLRRNYFTRLWVVQEVVLAANPFILCGSHFCRWDYFTSALDRLVIHQTDAAIAANSAAHKEGWFEAAFDQLHHFDSFQLKEGNLTSGTTLLSSILELSSRNCYDPHDRVYAIRSINGLEGSEDFLPDYELELSTLYRSVCVRAIIDKTWRQPLNVDVSLVLGLAGTESVPAAILERPSWVPHFHYLTSRSRAKSKAYNFTGATHQPQFVTTSYGMTCAWSQESPDLLLIKGHCFSVINDLLADSCCPQGYFEDQSAATTWSSDTVIPLVQWYLRCEEWIETHTCEPVDAGLLLCAGDDRAYDGGNELTSDAFVDMCSSLSLPEQQLKSIWRELRPFLMNEPHERIDRNRILASCDFNGKKHFAWVPPQASTGDSICIVPGAPWPFVLREDGRGFFRLIGDAYAQGVDTFDTLESLNVQVDNDDVTEVDGDVQVMNDPYQGADPFVSLSRDVYRQAAKRLDEITKHVGWLTLC